MITKGFSCVVDGDERRKTQRVQEHYVSVLVYASASDFGWSRKVFRDPLMKCKYLQSRLEGDEKPVETIWALVWMVSVGVSTPLGLLCKY